MQTFFYLIVAFCASAIGAICGMGGGVIIKPMLDMFQLDSVETISFLSSCTILSMTAYSVCRGWLAGDSKVNVRTSTPLAFGSVLGGVLGKQLFTAIQGLSADPDRVGAVQAAVLAVVLCGVLTYTLRKEKISSLHVKNGALCMLIGLGLGTFSSFIGIGGGQANLVVLFFFFSMDAKTAAQNSLYVILFSQLARLVTTLVTQTVPDFVPFRLALMIAGGICGGILGRKLLRKLTNRGVERLFVTVLIGIILVNIYNITQFL